MHSKKLLVAVLAVTAMLAGGARSEAGPIFPDVTVVPLDISFDGTAFSAVSSGGLSVISWTDALGVPDLLSPSFGDLSLSWSGGSGTLTLNDVILGTSLSGNVKSFVANLLSPIGATFELDVLLSSPVAYGFGNNVHVSVGSNDFALGQGTGQADITAVPEPATLSLLAFAGAVAAWRRRSGVRLRS